MGLASEQLAWITARTGAGRTGAIRMGAVGKSYELKADGSGELIWNRPVASDGDPASTAAGWATGRE